VSSNIIESIIEKTGLIVEKYIPGIQKTEFGF
jgi:hypothetical protein